MHLCRLEYLGRAAETIDNGVSAIFKTVQSQIGIGPRSMDRGDFVPIVKGCRVPLILRRHGSYFKLVGSAYVSGMMQGEAVSTATNSGPGPKFESIKLL